MKLSKQIVAAAAVATIGVGGVGATMASAATSTANDPTGSLVAKIATKFNLNKDEVQKVFDEERQTRDAEQQKRIETDLTQLVKDGKLTNTQKDAILAKRKAMQAERASHTDDMQSKTDAKRKAAMDAKKTELDTWAKQNNISTEYLRYVMGGGHGLDGPGGSMPPRG